MKRKKIFAALVCLCMVLLLLPTTVLADTTVATPTFDQDDTQPYVRSMDVTISCTTAGATVRYTTDGTEPDENSPVFSAPIHVPYTTTIKAKAFKTGMTASETATAEYRFISTVSSVSVNPATENVPKGGTQRFSATVTGSYLPPQPVMLWYVQGNSSNATTISTDGVLTVSSDETAATLTVKAYPRDDTRASGAATVTVTEATHGITVDKPSLDFGVLNAGYAAAPTAQTVTITYTGNIGSVALTQPASTQYDVGTLSRTTLDTTNTTATFTVQPKANLLAGTYDTPIVITTTPAQAAAVSVTPSFQVILPITVTPAAAFPQGGAPFDLTIHVGNAGSAPNNASHFGRLEISGDGVNFTVVPSANYTLSYGSVHITFQQSYLNTLAPGVYTLHIYLAGAFAGAPLTTHIAVVGAGGGIGEVGEDVPKTGDNAPIALLCGLVLLSGAGLAVSAAQRRRRRNND